MKKLHSNLGAASAVLFWALSLGCGMLWAVTAVAGQTVLTQKQVPITITKSGSYILGSNLTVTQLKVHAITIAANNVTLDLNGFTIQGPDAGQSGASMAVLTESANNVVVRNGVVWGFNDPAGACVHLDGIGNRVEDVRFGNCGHAIFVGRLGTVRRCQVYDSEGGIDAAAGSVVVDNTLSDIGNTGIFAGWGSLTIVGNSLLNPTRGGGCIVAQGSGNRIEGNSCTGWGSGLVLTGSASYFAKNVLSDNNFAVEGGDWPNIDGGTIDPALSNVIIPETP